MASSLNKVMLMGNITRDIELRHTGGSKAVATIGLAINHKWKTPEGEAREEVVFVDCDAWGKTAEVIAQYFAKGKPILIEGRLKLDSWDDKTTGKKQSKLKVVIEAFYFVDSKKDSEAQEPAQSKPPAKVGSAWSPRKPAMTTPVGRAMAGQPEPLDPDGY